MNTTSGPGQHHEEVALYVAHIPREEKQQIKMLMTNLLIFVLVPVFVFACKRARATFFPNLKTGHMGPPFFQFLRHGHMGHLFSIFRHGHWGHLFTIFKTWALGHLYTIFKTWAYGVTFLQFLRHGHTGPPFFNF